MDFKNYLEFAVKIAREAGKIQRDRFHTPFQVDYKNGSTNNPVTEIDRLSEKLILEKILTRFPDHNILTEESGKIASGSGPFRWVIDPLDGTNNYAHHHPFFAVSIGLEYDGEMVVGVIYTPIFDELFEAAKGYGAYLNGKPIHVSMIEKIEYAILGTGFAYEHKERNFPYFEQLVLKAQGVRRCGAAALELAYLAAGRQDGFWEFGLQAWDFAAAKILIEEAGGKITNLQGGPLSLADHDILASNTRLHQDILTDLEAVKRNKL